MILKGINTLKNAFSSYSKAMYESWKQNANQVHQDWQEIFKTSQPSTTATVNSQSLELEKSLALRAYMLIRYFKTRGHELAELDPLRLVNFKEFGKVYVKHSLENDLAKHKIIEDKDLETPFTFPSNPIFEEKIAQFIGEKSTWTLKEIYQRLNKIYSDKVGIQFMHISDVQERAWIMKRFEKMNSQPTSKEQKLEIYEQLTKSETFNYFLNDKLKTSKRFGIEGLDSMICGLNKLVELAAKSGVEYIGLGTAHRGRLTVLANVFDKPLQKIFAQFQQNIDKEVLSWGNSGDVKYHLGSTTQKKIGDKTIKLSVIPNPSHLETVDPVVMGHVRSVMDSLGRTQEKALGVLIHGDAALIGQGVVYQCLQMSQLNHYNIGGVIHIVANNQIGFTTTPAEARSGLYCTNVAKSIQAPIIHVNGDEPELVNKAIKLAIEYRQQFRKDIVVDIIGYRRYGHNQQDQPAFTQPMMYETISKRPTLYKLYSQKLVDQGIISKQQVEEGWSRELSKIAAAYAESLHETFDITKWRSPTYHSVVDFTKLGQIERTGINNQELKNIGKIITEVPSTFAINPTIKKIYEQRKKTIETGEQIDFGTAQALAFGTLLREGFNVRVGGQDVERGTFSHRHAVLIDQKTEDKWTPLHELLKPEERWRFQIENSLLSQYAAMGFEYGYAMTNPNTLTIWEAQFGDFANGAQIIIDNYLTSGESKWTVQNGLVLNLPHGMDGQGPEHSSGRMERYLQLMGDTWNSLVKNGQFNINRKALRTNNMSIICPSTSSNIFHSLRRQMRRDYRRPLITFVNKKLLKHKDATTTLQELNKNHFDTVIDDTTTTPEKVTKVVLVYGQAYYAAFDRRAELKRQDVALIRIQQLAPLHYDRIFEAILRYPNAKQYVWFQEEHKNSGAWSYVYPRLSVVLEQLKKQGKVQSGYIECVSRRHSASTAVGKKKKHDEEHEQILKKLFKN